MTRLIMIAAILTAPLATAAQATTTDSAATNSVTADSPKAPAAAEKKICKQLPSSSSRLPKRACFTKEQWRQIEEEAQSGY
jgi:hypothetical protein